MGAVHAGSAVHSVLCATHRLAVSLLAANQWWPLLAHQGRVGGIHQGAWCPNEAGRTGVELLGGHVGCASRVPQSSSPHPPNSPLLCIVEWFNIFKPRQLSWKYRIESSIFVESHGWKWHCMAGSDDVACMSSSEDQTCCNPLVESQSPARLSYKPNRSFWISIAFSGITCFPQPYSWSSLNVRLRKSNMFYLKNCFRELGNLFTNLSSPTEATPSV